MIKTVWYLSLFLSLSSYALVPVEGILMGEAQESIQTDPLRSIFSDIYDTSQSGENKKIRLYQSALLGGQNLNESCGYLGGARYSTSWQEKQARRSIAATLQYIGLDTTIKAIGAYAKKLELGPENFKTLSRNLVKNYCSKNITVFSLRNIERSLEFYYDKPFEGILPSVNSSPFATHVMKVNSEKASARSREFDLVIRNFRAFCSWGGEVDDYRMLGPYLNNRFIMAFVFKNMLGVQDQVDEKSMKVSAVKSENTVQVGCTDLICRKETPASFKSKFPLSVGSTGLQTDLSKIYCHHLKFQDAPQVSNAKVKSWIKAQELEDPIFETSQFISVMTGIPDLFNSVETYQEIPLLVKSSVDERWNKWSKDILSTFSSDLHYEESLKVKADPRRDIASIAGEGFRLDFSVTLGEMDRLIREDDKLNVTFHIKLSKNYLRSLRTKWVELQKEVDTEGQKTFKEEVGRYINLQLKEKEKLFTQKLWNDDFGRLIGEELLQQTLLYRGTLFHSYRDEMVKIPVKFSYGLFAISYLRFRSDVAAERFKLNL